MSPPPESSGSSAGGEPSGGGGRAEAPFDAERAWREGFDAWERAVGRPLEAFMGSEEFADAAARFFKANAELQSELQQGSDAWRSAWGVPGREDVQDLRVALEALRGELRAVRERLAAIEEKLG
jgi:Poly(R)-hydroxyalkanoic acid synthase subunit (PHA_synth_III_E)